MDGTIFLLLQCKWILVFPLVNVKQFIRNLNTAKKINLLDKGHVWEKFWEISPCKNSNIMIITVPTFIGIYKEPRTGEM